MARLSFAVVREDFELEASLIERIGARSALVVASGGCTALSLLARFPALEVVGFDINPAQLDHTRLKAATARRGGLAELGVGNGDEQALHQRGEFEKLFRLLRAGVEQLVASRSGVERFFSPHTREAERRSLLGGWVASPYWAPLFVSVFHDELLRAMFGPAATQHAAPGSYPPYFQGVFERGLRRPEAHRNPFLQHILLGHYLPGDEPLFLRSPAARDPGLVLGSLPDVPGLERFDLFSLSNVLDWSDDAGVEAWARALRERARPGSVILIRQLNNRRDVRRFFSPDFRFDDALGQALFEQDRSLFYERIEVGVREPAGAR